MTLRSTTAVSVGLVLLACIAVTFGMSYFLISAGMQRSTDKALAEISGTRETGIRAAIDSTLAAIGVDAASLAARAAAWARRDDTYSYVENRSSAWRSDNLPDSVCSEYGLSVVVIASSSGRVVDRLSYDLDRRSFGDMPAGLAAAVAPGGALEPPTIPAGGLSGIIWLPEGALLVAASPILPAGSNRAPRGAFIVGRFLSAGQIASIGERAGASIELYQASAESLPSEARALLKESSPAIVVSVTGAEPAGYARLAGTTGSPAAIVRVTLKSDVAAVAATALSVVSRQAAAASFLLAVLLGGSALIVLGSTLLVVDRAILRRAAKLTSRLEEIAANAAPGSRVEVHGDDELARLEGALNEAFAAVEETGRQAGEREKALVAALDRTRLALQATGQLFFDAQSGRIAFEGAVSRVTGYPPEELHSIPLAAWEAMVHPEDRQSVVSTAEQAASSGTAYRVDYRLKRKDSSYVMVEERGIRAPGTEARMVGTIRVIPPAPHAATPHQAGSAPQQPGQASAQPSQPPAQASGSGAAPRG